MIAHFKSSKTIFLIQVVICNRFTFVLMFRFWFAFALSHSYHRMICADFKTINSFVKWSQNDQVFCQMILKRSSFLRSNFLNFISRLKFLFRTQLVHAKTTFSCDRRYYKERDDDRWWWLTNDATTCCFFSQSENVFMIFVFLTRFFLFSSNFYVYRDPHFLSVSLKLLCDLSLRIVCNEKFHAFLRMFCLLLSIVLYQCFFREIDVVVVCLSFVEMSEL
jgi:hypothetical protein